MRPYLADKQRSGLHADAVETDPAVAEELRQRAKDVVSVGELEDEAAVVNTELQGDHGRGSPRRGCWGATSSLRAPPRREEGRRDPAARREKGLRRELWPRGSGERWPNRRRRRRNR